MTPDRIEQRDGISPNKEKDLFVGLEPHTFCYPGRCPKPVKPEERSSLRFKAVGDHYGHNTSLYDICEIIKIICSPFL